MKEKKKYIGLKEKQRETAFMKKNGKGKSEWKEKLLERFCRKQ